MSPESSRNAKKGMPPISIGWQAFWILLLLPAILMLLLTALMLMEQVTVSEVFLYAAILLWPVCALYCGIWAGIKLGAQGAQNQLFPVWILQSILSVVLVIFIAAINLLISLGGCSQIL